MKQILFCILFFAGSTLYCKDAVFVFVSLNDSSAEFYNSLEITVNNTKIGKQDKKYKIKPNQQALDTIRIKSNDPNISTQEIITRLRSGETYSLVFNPCSIIEIIPSTEHEGIRLVRLVAVNRDSSKAYLNSFYCFIDPEQVRKKDTTDYFHNASSGYCRYAVSSFDICPNDLDGLNDGINDQEEIKSCNGITLYFSGQEMYTLIYDYKTKLMTARFDGYYTEGSKVKIGQITE